VGEAVGLSVRDVTVRFGGAVAVDAVSVDAPRGRITSLIGPNGAGKTTTFNVCSGLQRPAHGQVLLDDQDVTAASPQRRAQLGLGRTFQRMELFDTVTVAENIALGCEALLAGSRPLRHLYTRRGERAKLAGSVDRSIELCDLADLADRPVGGLSTGQRRLVELARAVAGDFTILLLDEPSSGLDHHETEAFGQILTTLVRERGTGILLVEHDMSLVMSISAHLYVLDFGRVIFEGAPTDAQASPEVREAYLGAAS
jgi:ABC-type branched-subunit amino acid transport system ATPase component